MGEATVQGVRELIDLCAGLDVAGGGPVQEGRPAGGLDVAAADDEVVIRFEAAEDAQVVYDFLTGVGTGIQFLAPGEVVLRILEGWDQRTLNFAPHVRYLKPEVIAAVLEVFADRIQEQAWADAQRELAEEVRALVEFNPYHDKAGNFASKGKLKRAKAGSYSAGNRKNKVSAKGKKALKLVATKLPCGRDARDAGINQRCWDGQRIAWTGQAVARVLRKAVAAGKVREAVTADDRVILERAAALWTKRKVVIEETDGLWGQEEYKDLLDAASKGIKKKYPDATIEGLLQYDLSVDELNVALAISGGIGGDAARLIALVNVIDTSEVRRDADAKVLFASKLERKDKPLRGFAFKLRDDGAVGWPPDPEEVGEALGMFAVKAIGEAQKKGNFSTK